MRWHGVGLLCSVVMLAACAPSSVPVEGLGAIPSEREMSLIRQAQATARAGDAQNAIALYREAASLSHGAIEAHLALAALLQEQGDVAGAREVLQEAKQRQPKHPAIDLALGKLEVHAGRGAEALVHYEAGLAEWPQNIDLLNGKGVALDLLGRHTEAQQAYLAALGQGKSKTEFISNNLAMNYIMIGRYTEAIEVLEGIPNVQGIPVMRQNLALAYGLKGDMESAKQWAQPDLTKEQLQENIAFYKAYKVELGKTP